MCLDVAFWSFNINFITFWNIVKSSVCNLKSIVLFLQKSRGATAVLKKPVLPHKFGRNSRLWLEISRKPAKKFQIWGWLSKRINEHDPSKRTLQNLVSDEKLSAFNLKIRQWLYLYCILLDIVCGNILNQYVQPTSYSF